MRARECVCTWTKITLTDLDTALHCWTMFCDMFTIHSGLSIYIVWSYYTCVHIWLLGAVKRKQARLELTSKQQTQTTEAFGVLFSFIHLKWFPFNTFLQWCVNNFYYWHFVVQNGGCTSFRYLSNHFSNTDTFLVVLQPLLGNPCSFFEIRASSRPHNLNSHLVYLSFSFIHFLFLTLTLSISLSF